MTVDAVRGPDHRMPAAKIGETMTPLAQRLGGGPEQDLLAAPVGQMAGQTHSRGYRAVPPRPLIRWREGQQRSFVTVQAEFPADEPEPRRAGAFDGILPFAGMTLLAQSCRVRAVSRADPGAPAPGEGGRLVRWEFGSLRSGDLGFSGGFISSRRFVEERVDDPATGFGRTTNAGHDDDHGKCCQKSCVDPPEDHRGFSPPPSAASSAPSAFEVPAAGSPKA